MRLVLVGLNHQSAPIDVRERLSCADHVVPRALGGLLECEGVREAAVLSTCNRMELYAVVDADDAETAYALLTRHLSRFHAVPEEAFGAHLYKKSERDAAIHLARVAAGVDSMVIGEGQILGQVRTALQVARQAGGAGPLLNALFQQAIVGGKRVRTETSLGRGAFSIGRAAVDLARTIFANLSHANVLILGAGKMSELTARHLQENGVKVVVVANRTHDRAVALAERLGGSAIQYDAFPDALVTTDIVISSTAAPHPIIQRSNLQPILKRRRGRPLFLIDIAVPRDVATDVADLDNVFLYNIDDLQAVVASDGEDRLNEVVIAEALALEEAERFLAWRRTRDAAPAIAALQARLEEIRLNEMDQLRAQLPDLDEAKWTRLEIATRSMMRKVARTAIHKLKESAGGAVTDVDLVRAAEELFGIEGSHVAERAVAVVDTPSDERAEASR